MPKRYTPEFKTLVVETLLNERLNYSETARQFGVARSRITAWERIYLGKRERQDFRWSGEDAARPRKLPKKIEEDLLAEVQR